MSIAGIPNGVYNLDIGESFFSNFHDDSNSKQRTSSGKRTSLHHEPVEVHTLRFDFKPKHYESGSEDTFISFDGTEGVQLIMPIESDEKSSKNDSEYTLYKGSKKAIKGEKECMLTFNKKTRELRLERLSSNIVVKKTRGEQLGKTLRDEIQLLKTPKPSASRLEVTTKKSTYRSIKDEPICHQSENDLQETQHTSILDKIIKPSDEFLSDDALSFNSSKGYDRKSGSGRNSLLKQETGSGDNKDHSPSSSTVSKSEAKTPAILDVRNEDNKDQKLKCDRSTSSMKSVLQMDLQLSESSSSDEGDGASSKSDSD